MQSQLLFAAYGWQGTAGRLTSWGASLSGFRVSKKDEPSRIAEVTIDSANMAQRELSCLTRREETNQQHITNVPCLGSSPTQIQILDCET